MKFDDADSELLKAWIISKLEKSTEVDADGYETYWMTTNEPWLV